jgi:sugar-specific transcriptional regulator TrmB
MDKLLSKLQASGLTQREAHIYLALLQKKEFVASELASIIPVGRTKVYEIIPNLIAKGLCTEVNKNGKKMYCAVEPKSALKSLLTFFQEKITEEISKKEEEITKKRKIFDELEIDLGDIYTTNVKKSDSLDYIEVIKDRNQIRNRWIELQKNTRQEMLSFNKPPFNIGYSENMKHQKKMMNKKNTKSRGIYEYDISRGSTHTDFIKIIDHFKGLGEECRIIGKLPMKLIIIDEKITMLALNDPVSIKQSITTMIVTHPSFALAQKEVFESYWSKSLPCKDFKKSIKVNKT